MRLVLIAFCWYNALQSRVFAAFADNRLGVLRRELLALFWSVFLLHKIYGAQIGAFVNNAVEVGEKLTELRDG